MSGFWIQEIRAHRKDAEPSRISLQMGLNLIVGPSNTGKTCVARTVDYVMGSDEAPFVSETGYNRAEIDIVTDDGELITLARSFGGEYVVSPQADGDAKVYSVKRDENDPTTDLNTFLVSLIDLKPEQRIINNSSWKSESLTWRNLYHLLWIPESYIDRADSTVLRKTGKNNYVRRTAELCTILVVAQDKNYDDIPEEESPSAKRLRQRSVKQFVAHQLHIAHERDKELQEIEAQYSGRDIEKELRELTEKFNSLRAAQIELTARGREITATIRQFDEAVAVYIVDRSQRTELISQLKADLDRLDFLAEANAGSDTLSIDLCGYCHQPTKNEIQPLSETQINAQRAELQDQLRGAQSNLNDINRALAQINEQRRVQADQLARLQNQIDRDLAPRQQALSRDIKALKEIAGIQQRREQIRETITALTTVEKEQEQQRPPFKPLEEFNQDFFYTMNETIRRILTEIGFPGAETIKFDEETLDVTVAGHEKKIEGKGYVSLLNTVVLLAFHEYLDQYSPHTPGFLLIDSPLKNFDDTQLKASESMRRKLLEYIARTNTNRQVILCENSDRLTDIDLDELPNTSVTQFTKNPNKGRYGYLADVYEPGEQIDD